MSNPSIALDDAIEVLRNHLANDHAPLLNQIVKDLMTAQRESKAEAEATKEPRGKTRLAIVIKGDEALKAAVSRGAYVLSVPDPEDDATLSNTYMGEGLLGRILTACRAHNTAPKGKRSKGKRAIKTLHDAMTLLKAKVVKGSGSTFTVKQKGVPVEVIVVTGPEELSL